MDAFENQRQIGFFIMSLLLPTELQNDEDFWSTTDKHSDSILALAVKNPKPHCVSRLQTLNQYVPRYKVIESNISNIILCIIFFKKKKKKKKSKFLPLMYACQYRDDLDDNIIKLLVPKQLENSPEFWLSKHPKTGNCLLHLAVQNSNPNCLQRLQALKKAMPEKCFKELIESTNKVLFGKKKKKQQKKKKERVFLL
ncbi:hypothetical protein RFI_15090 [Reticulomyxa filosa]|uniref:Ankyrin repeat protein n=1 Tax=Reticulomyxa filosa TaxID=46433 RepID=X6N9Y2_RETFI|nr:hypothetical protein RFI_15090 [Reticulomyxa filosa]|eukprot:ETO22112.1 hypothetical protein RFI_15090 [Reticulomyxa filosa]